MVTGRKDKTMRWDFYCFDCKETHELTFPNWDASLDARCKNCKSTRLERKPCAGTFKVTGYNAQNGYSKGFEAN